MIICRDYQSCVFINTIDLTYSLSGTAQHAYEVVSINFVVYMDRKNLEIQRCREFQSTLGMIGIFAMFTIDMMQTWLSTSIILSWVTTSKYFFPIPSLPLRPAQLMGGQVAQSSLANYGINMGPIAIGWLLRFLNGKVQLWTGKALADARRTKRRERRKQETEEERELRKARKRELKTAALAVSTERSASSTAVRGDGFPSHSPPLDSMVPVISKQARPTPNSSIVDPVTIVSDDAWEAESSLHPSSQDHSFPVSDSHRQFLQQLEEHQSNLDDWD